MVGPRIRTALARGLRKRCPHCGEGFLFRGWGHHLDECAVCGLVYERNPGDTWAFTILLDRLPLGLMIALVYLGVFMSHRGAGLIVFAVIIALFVWTSPYRWGLGIALHYLSRVCFPEPADPIPPPGPRAAR